MWCTSYLLLHNKCSQRSLSRLSNEHLSGHCFCGQNLGAALTERLCLGISGKVAFKVSCMITVIVRLSHASKVPHTAAGRRDWLLDKHTSSLSLLPLTTWQLAFPRRFVT